MSRYSREIVERLFDDESGFFVEVGPDSDGLDLVAIKWGEIVSSPEGESIAFDEMQARFIGEALIRAANRMNPKGAPHA